MSGLAPGPRGAGRQGSGRQGAGGRQGTSRQGAGGQRTPVPRTSTPRATPPRGTPPRGSSTARATPPPRAARVAPTRPPGTPVGGVPRAGSPTGTVSNASMRFAARVRRRRRQRAGVVVVAVASGLGLGWLVFGSPVLAVHDVEVRGVQRVPAAEIEALAASEVGRSMALASPETVAEKIEALPLVRSVRVERSWPATLVVTVTEREPIAGVPAARGRIDLLDGDGVVIETVAKIPAGLPLLEVDVTRSGAATLRAARDVAADIPASMRAGIRSVKANSPDAVSFVLADGTTVVWGSAQDGDRKAAALLAVRPRRLGHHVVIDVSAPDAPAVTGA